MKFNDTFTCLNPNCKQSLGMIGTEFMWEKVASLAKIRNASKKYTTKPEIKEKRTKYMRNYRKKHFANASKKVEK